MAPKRSPFRPMGAPGGKAAAAHRGSGGQGQALLLAVLLHADASHLPGCSLALPRLVSSPHGKSQFLMGLPSCGSSCWWRPVRGGASGVLRLPREAPGPPLPDLQ